MSPRPPRGNDDIDQPGRPEQGADRRAVPGRDKLDRGRRQSGALQPLDQAFMDRPGRVEALRAAAQDGGVTGFKTQAAGIRGDVRPRFVDDADDAQRYPDPLDGETVGPVPFGDDAAQRVGQGGDVLQALGDRLDPLRRQGQPVDEGGAQPVGPFQVHSVGLGDGVGTATDRGGGIPKSPIPLLARCLRQDSRRMPGGGTHLGNQILGGLPGDGGFVKSLGGAHSSQLSIRPL